MRAVRSVNGETVIGELDKAGALALREDLYTPGELLRTDQLSSRHGRPCGGELAKAIRIAAARVQGPGGVLVLRDGDDADIDCPVQLAEILRPGQNLVPVGVEIVIAYQEYESWFLAAADSLRAHPDVRDDAVAPANPEGRRDAKRELEKLMLESYKETRHQPKFSALIDLKTASKQSRSSAITISGTVSR